MEYKIHKSNQFGISILEIVIAVTIGVIVLVSFYLIINPAEKNARGRDQKRLSDLQTLDRAINEFNLDNNRYPDSLSVTRESHLLPTGNSGPVENILNGWIDEDLSIYTNKLPIDPINNTTYRYRYRHDSSGYELNAVLEYHTELSNNDGGNSATYYEIGNNLSLL